MNRYASGRGPVKALMIIGGVLPVVGILIDVVPFDYGTIPQWNGLCSSGIGQFGQLISAGARQDCGLVGAADHLIGWLIAGGIACLAAAFVLAARSQAGPFRPPPWPAPAAGGTPFQYSVFPGAAQVPQQPAATAAGPSDPYRRGRAWLRQHWTLALVAALACAAGAAVATSAALVPGSGNGQLLSFLCWNGPGDNSSTLLQWPSGSTVAGTYRTAGISGTAPGEQVSDSSGALTGTVSRSQVSLDFGGLQQVFGRLGTGLVLSMPQPDGSVQPVACKRSTTQRWNAALSNLNQQVSSDNAAAAAQQQQQNIANQISQAQQQLASDVATLTSAATALDTDKSLAGVIAQMQQDYAAQESDYQAELADSCIDKPSDAAMVSTDASTVSSDQDTLQGDIDSLQDNTVSQDLTAVQSDANTVTNLGGTPDPDPSAAIAAGNKALSDLSAAIASETSTSSSIVSQAQQLASEAQAAETC